MSREVTEMKTTSPDAEKLLANLRATPVGQSLPIASPVPGIDPVDAQAVVLEASDDRWFRLGLYWQGVSMGEFTVEVIETIVSLEAL
jgi:hypothetical protein